jgi:hypothetical protein
MKVMRPIFLKRRGSVNHHAAIPNAKDTGRIFKRSPGAAGRALKNRAFRSNSSSPRAGLRDFRCNPLRACREDRLFHNAHRQYQDKQAVPLCR